MKEIICIYGKRKYIRVEQDKIKCPKYGRIDIERCKECGSFVKLVGLD